LEGKQKRRASAPRAACVSIAKRSPKSVSWGKIGRQIYTRRRCLSTGISGPGRPLPAGPFRCHPSDEDAIFAGQLFAGKQTNEFTLLNQGVADFAFGSTINWSPQVKELNLLWTSQKHVTLWHYAIDPMIVAVSKVTWDALTPSLPPSWPRSARRRVPSTTNGCTRWARTS
jgi:hypothetical protein